MLILRPKHLFKLGLEDAPVLQIDFYDVPGERIVAAIQMGPDGRELHLVRYKAKRPSSVLVRSN